MINGPLRFLGLVVIYLMLGFALENNFPVALGYYGISVAVLILCSYAYWAIGIAPNGLRIVIRGLMIIAIVLTFLDVLSNATL